MLKNSTLLCLISQKPELVALLKFILSDIKKGYYSICQCQYMVRLSICVEDCIIKWKKMIIPCSTSTLAALWMNDIRGNNHCKMLLFEWISKAFQSQVQRKLIYNRHMSLVALLQARCWMLAWIHDHSLLQQVPLSLEQALPLLHRWD